jgi:hypothetical protein
MLKRSVYFLALLLAFNSLHAQIELIGLFSDAGSGNLNALRWDAQSGVAIDSIVTPENSVYAGSSVFNANTGEYYFRSTNGLNRVDFAPDTFAYVSSLEMGTSAEIDMSNGQIYGVDIEAVYDSVNNLTSLNLLLLQYSTVTGSDSVVGNVPGFWGVIMDASAFNSNTGDYYIIGLDSSSQMQIVRMSTRGAFSYSIVPVNAPFQQIFSLEYDNEYNVLYGMASNNLPSSSALEICQIDINTGNLTLEIGLPQVWGIQSTTQTFDQTTSSFIFVGVDTSNNYLLNIYRTVQNTLSIGVLPRFYAAEIEADNSQFAANRYGNLTGRPAPAKSAVRLYPNPANQDLRIQSDIAMAGYEVLDLSGRVILRGNPAERISVAGLAPGCYLLQGQLADGQLIREKFIKE